MANTYLLLRDNKESGPSSFNDLVKLGLKAYDLVWVQGRSAAWRYPGEVEELKEFSPAVEEQPYDRFFKKSNREEKKEVVTVAPQQNFTPKKSVFVTMPEQNELFAKTNIEEQVASPKTITIKENPVTAQIRYAEPIDEIKERYTRTLQQRKQKIARKNIFIRNIKKASVFLYMIALGILIGLTLKLNLGKKNIAATQPVNNSQEIKSSSVQNNPAIQEEKIVTTPDSKEIIATQPEQKEKTIARKSETEKKNVTLPKKESDLINKTDVNTNQVSPGIDLNTVTGERNKKSRTGNTDNTEEKAGVKDDIFKLVSVTASDYKRGAFGGIRDLQLTVSNNSKYILDDVTVELQYLKPSEQPLKSENIEFKSIGPNGSLTISIPPSNRGIKVAYKIIKIQSKEKDDATAGL
ncbi:MAG TPA: hypothetical protein VET23_06385 [Chitinophagaceae bacterium]|nr:hypothetical protein [Chitinophagaceae bacterium]